MADNIRSLRPAEHCCRLGSPLLGHGDFAVGRRSFEVARECTLCDPPTFDWLESTMSHARRYYAPIALPADADFSVVRDAILDVDDRGRITYCGRAAEAPPVR